VAFARWLGEITSWCPTLVILQFRQPVENPGDTAHSSPIWHGWEDKQPWASTPILMVNLSTSHERNECQQFVVFSEQVIQIIWFSASFELNLRIVIEFHLIVNLVKLHCMIHHHLIQPLMVNVLFTSYTFFAAWLQWRAGTNLPQLYHD